MNLFSNGIQKQMLDFNLLSEFSRQNCVAICAFLVPANLITTIQTLILLYLMRPIRQIRLASLFAIVFAFTLFLHISTWIVIGVFTPVSILLFGLGTTCIIINCFAAIYPRNFGTIMRAIGTKIGNLILQKI